MTTLSLQQDKKYDMFKKFQNFKNLVKMVFSILHPRKFKKVQKKPRWKIDIGSLMLLKKNQEKISKIERGDSFLVCFRGLFWSLGVCVGGIVSDYCMLQIDLEKLFCKRKKFLNHYLHVIAKPQISDDHFLRRLWV
jgi:hypothetical protein